MYFTEGQLREYERMMQEKPIHERSTIKPVKEQDRKKYLNFDKHYRKCSKEKSTLLDDEQGR